MAALTTLAPLAAAELEEFLAAQDDLSPKAWPRYVRLVGSLPRTATNKVVKRQLAKEGPVAGDGRLFTREARGTSYA
jgi:fatty-acyl-CoA synthase